MAELSTTFSVNGKLRCACDKENQESLAMFLRNKLHLRGTKVMCGEGGCGACVVAFTKHDPISGNLRTKSVASCLLPVYQCDGASITTVEGLGSKSTGYHKVQQKLAEFNASQCGYCSPGMAMNLYSVLTENPHPSEQLLEDSLDGNICRCTGYRPIMDAMKSFARPNQQTVDAPDIEDLSEWSCLPSIECTQSSRTVCKVYRPKNLRKLYILIDRLNRSRYKLVFGNTGSALYRSYQEFDALIDVHQVAELYQFSAVPSSAIVLGSNLCLNDVSALLRQVATKDPELEQFKQAADHVSKIGNTHIRNIAGWAGNLMLKHQHRHFSSDMFLLFEALHAVLTIKHFNGTFGEVPIQRFLNTDMHGKVIEKVKIPIPSKNSIFKSYKIHPRAQNAPSYISCAFYFDIDRRNKYKVLKRPDIVYEGISDTFMHAHNTEQYLIGKELMMPEVLRQAFKVLKAELLPYEDHSLSSKSFRNSLGTALFYKYVLHVMGDMARDTFASGSGPIPRGLSRGVQEMDTNEARWPITEPVMKLEALKQCSGELIYTTDLQSSERLLHGAFVLTTVGNARLKKVDASEALKMEGVVRFLSAKDIPKQGKNSFSANSAPEMQEQLFCSDTIHFAGQAVGLIVAKSDIQAKSAVDKVKLEYDDVKKPTLDITTAMARKSFHGEASRINHENMEVKQPQSTEDSNQTVRGELIFGGQYHFFLENHSCLCTPTDFGLEVWSASQMISMVQTVISNVLALSKNMITVKAKPLGGAFGGKQACSLQPAAACALAAHLCNQAVRIDLPLDVTMKMLGKRLPYLTKYSVSFTKDCKLTGAYIAYYNDCGTVVKSSSADSAILVGDNVYECPTWILLPIKVKTNLPANTYFRAPGSVQAITTIEAIMDHIAHEMKMDPFEVRLNNANFINPDHSTSYLGRIIMSALQKSDYRNRRSSVEAFNKANRWMKKGISLTPLKYPLEYFSNKFNVKVSIYAGDGSIVVSHGAVEMGQGINTKVAQSVAYALGAPLHKIRVSITNTENFPNNQVTGGSIASELCCFEAVKCCKILKSRMKDVESSLSNKDWVEVVNESHKKGIDLSVQSTYSKNDAPIDYDIYSVAVSEVQVDILTGETVVQRVDIVYDCGQMLSPQIDIGQIEGGFIQGLGLMLTEKLRYHPDTGENLTHSTWTYYPPSSKDIPVDFRISAVEKSSNPFGVLSSRATGEPSVCLAASILLAVRYAVASARSEIGDKQWFMIPAPATPEEVFQHCLNDIKHFVLY